MRFLLAVQFYDATSQRQLLRYNPRKYFRIISQLQKALRVLTARNFAISSAWRAAKHCNLFKSSEWLYSNPSPFMTLERTYIYIQINITPTGFVPEDRNWIPGTKGTTAFNSKH